MQVPAEVVELLEAYFRLLAKWNVKINLTALPLQGPTDETFDRLFVEPLVAATAIPNTSGVWFDLGSGGGSPALPLKVVRQELSLTLVESKTRKAAFLREAVRSLALPATDVVNARFDELPMAIRHTANLVTARAVRPDATLFNASAELLKPGGRLFLFGKLSTNSSHPNFARSDMAGADELVCRVLTSYTRAFHVEQSR